MSKFSKAFDLDRKKISVDPVRFQGRQGKYSEDTVKAIVKKGKYDRSGEEIVVWKDPADGLYYVVSGHSRYEAATRLFEDGKQPDLNTIPVKEFNGDQDDAIDFATIESNRGSTEEGLKSDLTAYRRALERGWNRQRLLAAFKPESRLQKLKDLVNLNPEGSFLQYMGTDSEKHFPYLERNARWVGQLRDLLPLTNSHEQEIFNFFYKENEAGQKLSKDQFFKVINDKVNRLDFDQSAPLNLKNRVSTSALTDPISDTIREITTKIDRFNREAGQKRESIATAKATGKENLIPGLQKRISDINILVLRLVEEKQKLKQAAGRIEATSLDLFSEPAPDPAPKKVTDPAERQKIKNSIQEGEMIAKGGKLVSGKKMAPEQVEAVKRQVEKDKAKLDIEPDKSEKVKDRIKKKASQPTNPRAFEIGDLVNVDDKGIKYFGAKVTAHEWIEGNMMLAGRWLYTVQLPSGKELRKKLFDLEPNKGDDRAAGVAYPFLDPENTMYKTAVRAWDGVSYRPEQRGETFLREQNKELKTYLDDFKKLAEKHGTQDQVDGEFSRFARKYREFARDYLARQSGLMSTMITGPANFPSSRQRKKSDAQDTAIKKWMQWEKKAVDSIRKTLTNEPDKLGDPVTLLEQEKKKLENIEFTQERYRLINKAFRAFKKKPESLEKNTELTEGEKKFVREWTPQYSYEKAPVAPYQMQNLSAQARRVRERVAELEQKSEATKLEQKPTVKFDGGEVLYNATANRIQIFFDGKPEADTRAELKKAAFKWAPSQKAWQRAITRNAIEATAKLSFIKYEGPYFKLFNLDGPKKEDAPKTETPPLLDAKGERRIDNAALNALEAHLNTLPQTKTMHTMGGNYTTPREALHSSIIEGEVEGNTCVRREKPIAILTGGLPGSGKSTYIRKNKGWLTNDKIFKIDADDVRAKLPEYKGWNASQTHEETRDIVKKLLHQVGKDGCSFDVIYDGTMNKAEKYEPLVDQLKKEGYQVYILFMKIDKQTAMDRAMKRYQSEGRFVPREIIEEAAEKGLSAFNKLKTEVDGYVLVDGITQKVIDQGGKPLPHDRDYAAIGEVKGQKPQIETQLFDADFEKCSCDKGIAGALVDKEAAAKLKFNGKKLSASERAKSEKRIRQMVKEAEEKPGELTTEQVVAIGRRINAERSMYAQFMDLTADNKKRLWPTEKNLKTWAKNPGKYDLLGVDNFKETEATIGENRGMKFKLFGFLTI